MIHDGRQVATFIHDSFQSIIEDRVSTASALAIARRPVPCPAVDQQKRHRMTTFLNLPANRNAVGAFLAQRNPPSVPQTALVQAFIQVGQVAFSLRIVNQAESRGTSSSPLLGPSASWLLPINGVPISDPSVGRFFDFHSFVRLIPPSLHLYLVSKCL